MRQMLTTLLEAVGATLISAGVFVVSVPAGLIVCGAMLLGVGYLAGGDE